MAITSFSIVTTDAAPSTQQYHDRMPLVLEESQFEDWMRGPPELAAGMMKPYGAPRPRSPVGRRLAVRRLRERRDAQGSGEPARGARPARGSLPPRPRADRDEGRPGKPDRDLRSRFGACSQAPGSAEEAARTHFERPPSAPVTQRVYGLLWKPQLHFCGWVPRGDRCLHISFWWSGWQHQFSRFRS